MLKALDSKEAWSADPEAICERGTEQVIFKSQTPFVKETCSCDVAYENQWAKTTFRGKGLDLVFPTYKISSLKWCCRDNQVWAQHSTEV